ncbi:MAG: 50S ribosomal protein L10 [Hyphomicrobiaceae bacterium TMED74]|nr:50S ribosomal protein L10 [Filomicrobium sp.]RPG47138.1 MAG: 50S ribosomal protein L10 [Hyphomicrobiaceae bacterium TMED74]
MDRAAKSELVTQLHDVFQNTGVIVVSHYAGLSVAQMSDFRDRMRAAGGHVKVAKNRLAKIALQDTAAVGISDLFKGPTCLAYSEDPVTAAKVAVGYAKENEKLVILGGAMGSSALDASAIKALAELPSLDELRGTLVGLIQAPATKIARIVKEPGGQLARVIQAKASQGEAA